MADRKNPPLCATCGHSRSFHGNGTTPCRALGCHCERWEAITIGVQEVAGKLGRGQTWVKKHAVELGGVKVSNRDLGINRPGEVWRFPVDAGDHLEVS